MFKTRLGQPLQFNPSLTLVTNSRNEKFGSKLMNFRRVNTGMFQITSHMYIQSTRNMRMHVHTCNILPVWLVKIVREPVGLLGAVDIACGSANLWFESHCFVVDLLFFFSSFFLKYVFTSFRLLLKP